MGWKTGALLIMALRMSQIYQNLQMDGTLIIRVIAERVLTYQAKQVKAFLVLMRTAHSMSIFIGKRAK